MANPTTPIPSNIDPNIIPYLQPVLGQDPGAAFDLYNYVTTGSSQRGTGPFARFYEQFLAPLVLAAMEAEGGGVDPTTGLPKHMLNAQSAGDLFGKIKSGVAGQSDLFGLLGGIARRAMGDFMGSGAGVDYTQLKNFTKMLAPLGSAGLTPVYQDDFYRQQQNAFSDMYDKSLKDPAGTMRGTDWGAFFANSPFYKQNYGPFSGDTRQQQQQRNTPYQPSYVGGISGGGTGTGNH